MSVWTRSDTPWRGQDREGWSVWLEVLSAAKARIDKSVAVRLDSGTTWSGSIRRCGKAR
jgi:hypothetical protein